MRPPMLIAAISGRALAAAARRAGYAPRVLDLFRDVDTRRLADASRLVAGSIEQGFEAESLLARAGEIAPADHAQPVSLICGTGFEDRPDLLGILAQGRRYLGNSPAAIRATKDPQAFFALADRLGIPHPETRLAPPADLRGWLVKRVGASGGWHIRPARGAERRSGCYFQRFVAGRPVSALFLADGTAAMVLGFSAQWPAEDVPGANYLFGGAVQPAAIPDAMAVAIEGHVNRLSAALGLVGLNSADLLVRDDGYDLIEVNPRPGATLDIHDPGGTMGLFALHCRACEGDLPAAWRGPATARATTILYAPDLLYIPKAFDWPDWAHDLPQGASVIDRGAPVCTVLADGPTAAEAERKVRARADAVLDRLRQDPRQRIGVIQPTIAAGDPDGGGLASRP